MIYNNFVSDYLNKKAAIEEIDDYVKYWHTHETGLSLRDFKVLRMKIWQSG